MEFLSFFVRNFSYQALGRLRPGVTIEAANADVERMVPMAFEKFPWGIPIDMLESAQFGANLRYPFDSWGRFGLP